MPQEQICFLPSLSQNPHQAFSFLENDSKTYMKMKAKKSLKNNTVEGLCYQISRLSVKLQFTSGERTDRSTNGA